LLGLTLEGRRIEGVVLRRKNGGTEVGRSFEASLSLDPLTNDPTLVGQEIRNRLEEAGIRENRCAVGVPLNWAMTTQVPLPEMPEEDLPNFLGIQAEKGFPYEPDDLLIATSRCRSPKGQNHATLVGIPKNHLVRLGAVLTAARLKPVSFSLLVTALQPPQFPGSEGVLSLVAGENNVDLQVTCGGGVLVLRSLLDAIEMDGSRRQVDTDQLGRELRLTLGQIPQEFNGAITRIRLFGRSEWRQSLADAVAPVAKRLGLPVEVRSVLQAEQIGSLEGAEPNASPALIIAERCLMGQTTGFEFLPPKVSKLAELTSRFSSRRILYSSAAAGAALVLVGGAFLIQYVWLQILEARWRAIEPRATAIESIQTNIRTYRPWSNESRRSLAILRKLTEAFPEDGVITAKTIEIRNISEVSCSGTVQDNQALLKMREKLQTQGHVSEVQMPTIGGKRFVLNFHWTEAGNREN
jgi:hypothetical protein